MSMTHYMELLATGQPWNLVIYMAVPVVLAETLVATEFFVVYAHKHSGRLRSINRWVGIILGVYFLAIFAHLSLKVLPDIEWRGWIDVVAVGFYLSGVILLTGIALLETGIISRGRTAEQNMRLHFMLLIAFLVAAHVAMVFGMLDPALAAGSTWRAHLPM